MLSKPAVAKLAVTARTILAEGDTLHRDQFAQEGVSFSATSGGRTATADFHVDVGAGTRYDSAFDLVFRQVHRELDEAR